MLLFLLQVDTPALDFANQVKVETIQKGGDTVSSSLLLHNVSSSQDLTFECVATNSAGSDSRLISVSINGGCRFSGHSHFIVSISEFTILVS